LLLQCWVPPVRGVVEQEGLPPVLGAPPVLLEPPVPEVPPVTLILVSVGRLVPLPQNPTWIDAPVPIAPLFSGVSVIVVPLVVWTVPQMSVTGAAGDSLIVQLVMAAPVFLIVM
jgi:hypothetical protein